MEEKMFDEVIRPILKKLYASYEMGVIPSGSFLERAGEIGKRASSRRRELERLLNAKRNCRYQVRFGDYVQCLAQATGMSMKEAMFAMGCENLAEADLDLPTENTLDAAALIGVPQSVISDMMRAACVENLPLGLAALRDGSRPEYPHKEVAEAVEKAISSGSEYVKGKLGSCEERLSQYFSGRVSENGSTVK